MSNQAIQTFHGSEIRESMFGGHFMIHRTTTDPDGPLARFIETVDFPTIRYPGGTVTEEFFSPANTSWDDIFTSLEQPVARAENGEPLTKVKDVFNFASERDLGIQFVLPTNNYFAVADDGTRFATQESIAPVLNRVAEMIRGEHGSARIEVLQIGNEYFYKGRMTAQEYGQMANEMVKGLSSVFDAYRSELADPNSWVEPRIAVQAGVGWKPGDNRAIIDQLDTDARSEIDTVIVHYYPTSIDVVGNFKNHFAALREWEMEHGFENLNFYASEWNVHNVPDGDKGLLQTSTFIAAFEDLVRNGVTEASVWGGQHKFLDTRLATLSHNPGDGVPQAEVTTNLTPTGEAFRMLRESLVGMRSATMSIELLGLQGYTPEDDDAFQSGKLFLNSFANEDRTVVFISSRSDESMSIEFDLTAAFNGYEHFWAQHLSVIDDPRTNWLDEGNPTHPLSKPYMVTYGEQDVSDGVFAFELGPYEIIRIELTTGPSGVRMHGHDQMVNADANYNDLLIGSRFDDLIRGHHGNDTLIGGAGDDTLDGGSGNDTLSVSSGRNILRTGSGQNLVHLGSDSDFVVSQGAGDIIVGAGDNNVVLSVGDGMDFRGSSGADYVYALRGDNVVSGGDGIDRFYVSVDSNTIVTDYDANSGETLSFLGHYRSIEEVRSRVEVEQSAEGNPLDVVIFHDTGNFTVLQGAGSDLDAFYSSLLDFLPPAETAVAFAEMLNVLSASQIEQLVDSFATEDFPQWDQCDPLILLENLTPSSAGHFLSSLLPDERQEILLAIGRDGVEGLIASLSDEDKAGFIEALGGRSSLELRDWLGDSAWGELMAGVGSPGSGESGTDCGCNGGDSAESTSESTGELLIDCQSSSSRDYSDVGDFLRCLNGNQIQFEEDDEEEERMEDFVNSSTCFVASVAYRDREHPDVVFLRMVRDRYLVKFLFGRIFITFYWWFGPKLARVAFRRRWLSGSFRVVISVIVKVLRRRFVFR